MISYLENDALFDTEGHLSNAGLMALPEERLDELGRLEAAEHLSFCQRCLRRYTMLLENTGAPMRELTEQVQSMMNNRGFAFMMNRYVSAAAAVMLAFGMWRVMVSGFLPVLTQPDTMPRTAVVMLQRTEDPYHSITKQVEEYWQRTLHDLSLMNDTLDTTTKVSDAK